MYNILFHVSGIAILEICFYFYYIGPMETHLFEKVVGKLGNELYGAVEKNMLTIENTIDTIDTNTFMPTHMPTISNRFLSLPGNMIDENLPDIPNLAESDKIAVENIFTEFITNNTSSSLNDQDMIEMRNEGIDRRIEKNEKLFIEIIEYWCILTAISIFIYIISRSYKEYIKKKKERSIVPVTSEGNDIEMQTTRYRKGSDTEDNLTEDANKYYTEQCRQRLKYIGHYLGLGCCILGFQYLFFENVVLSYDPLSIKEVKYLLYIKFKPLLLELGY